MYSHDHRQYKHRQFCKSKIKHLNGKEPKKWWSCLCGMTKTPKDIARKLLPNTSTSLEVKITLANRINDAFLKSQQNFQPLSVNNSLTTTNAELQELSLQETITKLRRINPNKVGGPDGILKEFSHFIAKHVCSIMNSSFEDEALPSKWKCANIILCQHHIMSTHIEDFEKDDQSP